MLSIRLQEVIHPAQLTNCTFLYDCPRMSQDVSNQWETQSEPVEEIQNQKSVLTSSFTKSANDMKDT